MPARRFPVEYAVLGMLNERAMHGYALRERIDSTLGPLWRIATSQIYAALHLLQDVVPSIKMLISPLECPLSSERCP